MYIIKLILSEKMIDAMFLSIVSMVMVFCILACLSYVINIIYKLLKENNKSDESNLINNSLKESNILISDTEEEIIAVIMTCIIHATNNEENEIIVKKIKRNDNVYGTWNTIFENNNY